MALIKCPECGKEISDKSKACIHCGYPLDYVAPPSKLPKEEMVTVHVHRERKFTGSMLISLILVNGVQMGSVRNGETCTFLIKPGLSVFTVKSGKQAIWEGGSEATKQILVKPGNDLYISFSSGWSINFNSIVQKWAIALNYKIFYY